MRSRKEIIDAAAAAIGRRDHFQWIVLLEVLLDLRDLALEFKNRAAQRPSAAPPKVQ